MGSNPATPTSLPSQRTRHTEHAHILRVVALLLLFAGTGTTRAETWIGAWGVSPAYVAREIVANQTLRQTVRVVGRGSALRLRLTNALSNAPLVLGSATVARPAPGDGNIEPGSATSVTFGGQHAIVVPANATILSDPVTRAVVSGTDLSVSLYIAASARPTSHPLGLDPGYMAAGDQTTAEALSGATPYESRLVLAGIDVAGTPGAGTIVTLGDSITDGFRSASGLDRRWTDVLARRLAATPDLAALGIVNAGISGNRLLGDAHDAAGPNALARLARDVLAMPNLRFVCLLEGINDINHGATASDPAQRITAAALIAGYQQIIAQVHEHGAKVLIGTLTPFSGGGVAEEVRQQVNAWVRAKNGFEGVLDFDTALRDPRRPNQFLARYDSGDHLHPNDAGYAAMGDAVDLELFR